LNSSFWVCGTRTRKRKQLDLHVVECHVVAREIALKEWQQRRPELFVERIYEQAGFDNYPVSDETLTTQAVFFQIKIDVYFTLGCSGRLTFLLKLSFVGTSRRSWCNSKNQ
jgi:hypothetical protein